MMVWEVFVKDLKSLNYWNISIWTAQGLKITIKKSYHNRCIKLGDPAMLALKESLSRLPLLQELIFDFEW